MDIGSPKYHDLEPVNKTVSTEKKTDTTITAIPNFQTFCDFPASFFNSLSSAVWPLSDNYSDSQSSSSSDQQSGDRKTRRIRALPKRRMEANARERDRTMSVNSAFKILRTLIPTEPPNRKLSKIETLRLATSYISHLNNVRKAVIASRSTNPPKRCRKKISSTGVKETQTDHVPEDKISDHSEILIPKMETPSTPDSSFALFFPDKSMVNLRNGFSKNPGKNSSYDQLVNLIRSTRESIDLCIFVFSNSNLASELINLKSDWERDIKIRVIVDSREESINSLVEELISHGFKVKMNPQSGSVLMHHKFMIIDGRTLMTGSFNWTRAAVYYNHDNILVTKNSSLIHAYQGEFDKLWNNFIAYSSNELRF